jgi:hypothetical protein
MTLPDRLNAFWIPVDDSGDQGGAIRLGYDWLDAHRNHGEPMIVLNTKKMMQTPALAAASKFTCLSPSSHFYSGAAGAVLAIWPNNTALELAQRLALDRALCVIPGTTDVSWWMRRTAAVNVRSPRELPLPLRRLADGVEELLNSTIRFGGHNDFVGAGEKDDAVVCLRTVLAIAPALTSTQIEDFALESGGASVEGAARLAVWHRHLASGRRLRDHAGRAI